MKKLILTLLLALTLTACGTTETPVQTTPPVVEKDVLTETYFALTLDESINKDTELPQAIEGVEITWTSSVPTLIENNQLTDTFTTSASITASFSHDGSTMTKTFQVNYTGQTPSDPDVALLQDVWLAIDTQYDNKEYEATLDFVSSYQGVSLSYTSSSQYITNSNTVVRPTYLEGNQVVTIDVVASINGKTLTFDFDITLIALSEGTVYTGYYEGIDGLSGTALKNFLHNLIDDHTILTYDEVKYAIMETDEDPNNSNNVILFYTGISQAKSTFGGGANDFNREHVWAKSHGDFGNNMGPGTDLHHLRPTDASVNSSRGNLDFDEGGSEVFDRGVGTGNYKDSDSWEPRDEVKGDVARILFYMAVRYNGDDGWPDLELNNFVNNGSSPYIGDLQTLLQWHLDDPVDEFESNRNDVIFDIQGNRNPFIDHPELVELIFGTVN